jgi:hypothetical protein
MTFHKGLHTCPTLKRLQVEPKEERRTPLSGAFAEPSDGLEPSTPLPVVRLPRKRCGVGSHGFS